MIYFFRCSFHTIDKNCVLQRQIQTTIDNGHALSSENWEYVCLFVSRCTVGCVWNFQIGGGCRLVIFQFIKLKFDMVPYFSLINSPTGAKIFNCENGFLSLICIKLTRDTALKTISLDLLENFPPIWYITKLNFDCFCKF